EADAPALRRGGKRREARATVAVRLVLLVPTDQPPAVRPLLARRQKREGRSAQEGELLRTLRTRAAHEQVDPGRDRGAVIPGAGVEDHPGEEGLPVDEEGVGGGRRPARGTDPRRRDRTGRLGTRPVGPDS